MYTSNKFIQLSS